jgi:ComF family protein
MTASLLIRRAAASIMSTLLPSQCALCATADKTLCSDCAALFSDTAKRCGCCGLRLPIKEAYAYCGDCLSRPPAFNASLIATDYAPPIDRLVQDLKFRARLPLAAAFAQLLIDKAPPSLRSFDLILPLPLSRERLASRGFNQAMEIARPVAKALRLPVASSICVRVRDTRAQAELPLSERRVNMRGAFAVNHRAAVAGKQIIVIDDVMTTGHTLNEVAACLRRHGASRICNRVLARTPLR